MAQNINVDVTPNLFQPTLYYHQGDIGRAFTITISTKDGYTIPSGATVKIEATKPSGLGFSVSGTLSGNVVSFVSTEGMTDEYGRFPAQLKITSGNDILYTANFLMVGAINTHPASVTDGTAEQVISEITLLVERAETAASTAATDAANAAQARVDEMMDYLPSEVSDLKSDLTAHDDILFSANLFDAKTILSATTTAYVNNGDGTYNITTGDYGEIIFGEKIALPAGVYLLYGAQNGYTFLSTTHTFNTRFAQNNQATPKVIKISQPTECYLGYRIEADPAESFVIAPFLKQAVSADVSEIKADLNNINNLQDLTSTASWEQGGLNAGERTAGLNRIRTITYIPFMKGRKLTINITSGFKYEVTIYTAEKAFVSESGWVTEDRAWTATSDGYARVTLAHVDNSDITPTESTNISVRYSTALVDTVLDNQSALNVHESILFANNAFDSKTVLTATTTAYENNGDGTYDITTGDFGDIIFGNETFLPAGIYLLYGVPKGFAFLSTTAHHANAIAQNNGESPIFVTIANDTRCYLGYRIGADPAESFVIAPFLKRAITFDIDKRVKSTTFQIDANHPHSSLYDRLEIDVAQGEYFYVVVDGIERRTPTALWAVYDGSDEQIGTLSNGFIHRFRANAPIRYLGLYTASDTEPASVQFSAFTQKSILTKLTAESEYDNQYRIKLMNAKRKANPFNYNTLTSPEIFTIAHFSDIHGNAWSMKEIQTFKDKYGLLLDDVLCTGDVVADKLSDGTAFWRDNSDGKVLICIGNHDSVDNNGWDNPASQQTLYETYIEPYEDNWGANTVNGHTYWYKDYADKKIRLIAVDATIYDSTEQTAQMSWLNNALAGALSNGYAVVGAVHFPPMPQNVQIIDSNFTALLHGTETDMVQFAWHLYHTEILNAVEQFITNGGNFVCWLSGHTHWDLISYDDRFPRQLFVTISCAMPSDAFEERIRNADNGTGLLLNTVCVDTVRKYVKLLRYGAEWDDCIRHAGSCVIKYDANPPTVLFQN